MRKINSNYVQIMENQQLFEDLCLLHKFLEVQKGPFAWRYSQANIDKVINFGNFANISKRLVIAFLNASCVEDYYDEEVLYIEHPPVKEVYRELIKDELHLRQPNKEATIDKLSQKYCDNCRRIKNIIKSNYDGSFGYYHAPFGSTRTEIKFYIPGDGIHKYILNKEDIISSKDIEETRCDFEEELEILKKEMEYGIHTPF